MNVSVVLSGSISCANIDLAQLSASAAIALFGAVEWTSSDMRKRTRIMSELGQGLEYRRG